MTSQGTLMRRLLVVVLLVAAVGAGAMALRQPSAASVRPARATLGSPLWSARRVPSAVLDAAGSQRLTQELVDQTQGIRACVQVADADGRVAALDPDAARTPASTMKLLTAAAALQRLGPDFRFVTRVGAPGDPDRGRVEQLSLSGAGDPLLATPERIAALAADPVTAGLATTPLATLADRVVASGGVREVANGIVVEDRYFDAERVRPQWTAGGQAAIGPVGALTVNDGFAGAAGTGGRASDPAINAGEELRRLLIARGVTVNGPIRRSTGGSAAVELARVESPPLREIVTEMLSASDNLTAEMLLKRLGRDAETPGTTDRGIAALRSTLTDLGIDLTGASIVDGSGLSPTDALSCTTLTQVLELAQNDLRLEPIRTGLAIAGERGTLATHLVGTPLAGNLTAKTGTLSGVSGLAGYVTGDRPLWFSLLLNGSFGESTALQLREAIATAIASYPNLPVGVAIAPDPSAPIPPRACPTPQSAC
ncbi:MAG: D-alanyl-D-alanine carboxypeptidase/D-alanyl-D-alanine-endopeptidase [Acidimicrobiia bacterium]|nr:D-alanyl-D-alanine carboxypeptidase/D-alanyl-D-alanine-endopeptidase [Acidimicrobiia bacterium]